MFFRKLTNIIIISLYHSSQGECFFAHFRLNTQTMASTPPPNNDIKELGRNEDRRTPEQPPGNLDESARAPTRADRDFPQGRTSRHGEPHAFRYIESSWYSRPTPPPNVNRHPGQQQAAWHEYPPAYEYHYEYPPPRGPYFRQGPYDHSRWGEYPEDQWTPPRQRPAGRHWNESSNTMHEQRSATNRRARSPSDYGYRPSYIPGTETPPRSNRNRNDAASHVAPSHIVDWEEEHRATEADQPPLRNALAFDEEEAFHERGVLISSEEHITERIPPSDKKFIFKLNPYDVFCGRGVPNKLGPGNAFFKELVKRDQLEYISCRRNEKPPIATNIIEIIRDRGGRFLRRAKVTEPGVPDRYAWMELPENRIYEKVCQALRDGAPQIRQRMLDLDSSQKESQSAGKENALNAATRTSDSP